MKFAELKTDADFKKAAQAIGRADKTMRMRIHSYMQCALGSLAASGDWPSATTRINLLINELQPAGKNTAGVRVNAIKRYIEVFFGMVWNPEEKQFVRGKLKHTEIDVKAARATVWSDFTPEPEYKPLDAVKIVEQLLKKASDREDAKNGDNLPKDFMKGLQDLLAKV